MKTSVELQLKISKFKKEKIFVRLFFGFFPTKSCKIVQLDFFGHIIKLPFLVVSYFVCIQLMRLMRLEIRKKKVRNSVYYLEKVVLMHQFGHYCE